MTDGSGVSDFPITLRKTFLQEVVECSIIHCQTDIFYKQNKRLC